MVDSIIDHAINETYVTSIARRLFTCSSNITVMMYAMCEIFNALKQNTKVGKVYIECDADGFRELAERNLLYSWLPPSHSTLQSTVKCLCFKGIERISGFSAIALAIQQNKNLSSLGMYTRGLTRAQMVDVEWLLAKNALDAFEIKNCFPEGNILYIANGLGSNKSLKELSIQKCGRKSTLCDLSWHDRSVTCPPTRK